MFPPSDQLGSWGGCAGASLCFQTLVTGTAAAAKPQEGASCMCLWLHLSGGCFWDEMLLLAWAKGYFSAADLKSVKNSPAFMVGSETWRCSVGMHVERCCNRNADRDG